MTAIVQRSNKTSSLRQFLIGARCESKTFWATPGAFIFIVAMPLLAYAIVGFLNRETASVIVSFDGLEIEARERYYAAMMVFASFSACFTSTAIGMGTRRLDGRFRRLRTTAARPLPVMASLLVTWFLVAIFVDALITAMAGVFFGVKFDLIRAGELLAFTLLAIVTYMALGFAVSLFFRSSEAATPLANLIFFPLIFISGIFYDVNLGEVGNWLADLSPLKPFMSLVAGVFGSSNGASMVDDAAVLCGWLLACTLVIVWRFRWTSESEPRRSRFFARSRSADNVAD